MKIEFHYYITHLIAARAGFRGDDLRILAHASQLTDDNDTVYKIKSGRRIIHTNRISQSMRLIWSRAARLEVYPLFHFIPGEPTAESARRRDGKTSAFITTPDSPNANRVMDAALRTGNFHRIGIATHAYVDTWAHQNFVGFKSPLNKFSDFIDKIIPNIGHADAKTKPDQPRLIWEDERLIDSTANNPERFLEAAGRLFEKLRTLADPSCGTRVLNADKAALLADLNIAMGGDKREVAPSRARIAGYRALAASAAYGGTTIPTYRKNAWFNAAVKTRVRYYGNPSRGRRRRIETHLARSGFATSDWLNFQEAVKAHADRAKAILCETPGIADAYRG